MRSVYSYVLKIFDIKRRCKLTGRYADADDISDAAVEIFLNLLHRWDFLHFCDLFLVTPATEARPACISFDSLMPKIRSPDGSEFLSFQYQRHF